jgi:phosphohistidine phosphatase
MVREQSSRQSKTVYLFRHGEALSAHEDPARPLSPAGRQVVRRMARWLGPAELGVQRILHSGKLRAEQTARILAEQLQPPGGLTVTEGLKPNDDVGYAGELIRSEVGPLMLVGHFPHLGRLTAHLVTDNADQQLLALDTAALVHLVRDKDAWRLHGLISPDLLPRQ